MTCTQQPALEMTAGDNDGFTVTLRGVNLVGADFYRIRMDRPSGVLERDGVDTGELAQGRFLIQFDQADDLVPGSKQRVDVKWSIGGTVLTSRGHLLINVKPGI